MTNEEKIYRYKADMFNLAAEMTLAISNGQFGKVTALCSNIAGFAAHARSMQIEMGMKIGDNEAAGEGSNEQNS